MKRRCRGTWRIRLAKKVCLPPGGDGEGGSGGGGGGC